MREKKRYLAFEIVSKSKIEDFKAVSGQIKASVVAFLGELETAKAGLIVMGDKWSTQAQKGVIKIKHRHVNPVMASLALIDNMANRKVMVRSLGVSGTLKKSEGYLT